MEGNVEVTGAAPTSSLKIKFCGVFPISRIRPVTARRVPQ
jgi:hypothetical protein